MKHLSQKIIIGKSIVLLALLAAQPAAAQSLITGGSVRGQVSQSLATGGVSLLSSFDLDFGFGNDHQITRVKVLPNDASTSVSVAYNDKNSDDAYNYRAGFWGSPTNVALSLQEDWQLSRHMLTSFDRSRWLHLCSKRFLVSIC